MTAIYCCIQVLLFVRGTISINYRTRQMSAYRWEGGFPPLPLLIPFSSLLHPHPHFGTTTDECELSPEGLRGTLDRAE